MSYGSGKDRDDYDDHGDSGSKGQKSSYRSDSAHSSPSSRDSFGKTSSFSTMLSDDGKFFGVSLSPELKSQLDRLYPVALPIITEKAELAATRALGPKYGSAVGWGIALSEQIYKVGENLYNSTKSANDLRVAVQPLARANSQSHQLAPLSGSNEVIANARAKISSVFWQRMVDTAVSTIGAAPAIMMKVNQRSKITANHNLEKEIEEAAGDVQKLKALQEKRLNGTLTSNEPNGKKVASAKDLRAANAMLIEEREAEYIAKFKDYKAKRKDGFVKDLEEALKITPDNVSLKTRDLEKMGINTEPLKASLKGKERRDPANGNYYLDAPKDAVEEKAVIDKFIATIKGNGAIPKGGKGYKAPAGKSLDRYVDEGLRQEYAQKEGAWDETWRPSGSRRTGEKDEPTLKSQLQSDIKKLEEETRKLENEALSASKNGGHGAGKKDDMKDIVNLGWGIAASFTREVAGNLFGGGAHEQYKKPLALDRILHLRRSVEQPKDNPNWAVPEEVPPLVQDNGKRGEKVDKEKSLSYTQYLHEMVFQQHQKDCHRVEIGERFTQHFDKVKWDDQKIQEIPDEELSSYEFALKTLAKRVKDGRMDAIALIDLVGDTSGKKIVQNDGRSFGPQGAGKDEKDIKDAILKLIDEKSALMQTAQVKTEEQVNDKLANFVFSVDDMKKALETDTLDVEQRAFVFTMFSDVVGSDAKLCEKLGINNERCRELRKESQEHINQTLDSVVSVIAEMVDKDPDSLEKTLKITDKEKKLVKSLAAHGREDGKHAVDLTKDREEMELLKTLSANATMILDKDQAAKPAEAGAPVTFWQRVKNKIEELKNKPKEEPKSSAKHDDDGFDKLSKLKSSSLKDSKDEKKDKFKDDFDDDFGDERKSSAKGESKDSSKSSYKSHNPFDDGDDMEKPSFSHRDKLGKHGHDKHHDKDEHSDRGESKFSDRFEPRHSDKGEKWAADKHKDDDGHTGRIRRNRMESESETSVRGGLT